MGMRAVARIGKYLETRRRLSSFRVAIVGDFNEW